MRFRFAVCSAVVAVTVSGGDGVGVVVSVIILFGVTVSASVPVVLSLDPTIGDTTSSTFLFRLVGVVPPALNENFGPKSTSNKP